MAMHLCKSLISHTLKNPSNHLHKSHFCVTFSVLFSTSNKQKIQLENPSPVFEYLVEKHNFPPEIASKAASATSHLKTPEKCDLVMSFLKEIGFSNAHLENTVINLPTVLCANLENTIKPKIKVFQDLGFSATDIADIISANPWIFLHSADNRIMPTLSVLKNVLGSVTEVAKLLKVCGWFFKYDMEKTLLANIEFLKNCGVDSSQLTSHIFNFPRFFLTKTEYVKKYVEKVDKMGFDKKSKLYIYAITTVGSMTDANWERKLEVFRSLGFSEDEICTLFNKRPQVFAVSEKKIKKVIQVVLDTGKYDISVIMKHPGLLICSIEDRFKPRFEVLEVLEKKKLLKSEPGLAWMYLPSNKLFIKRFVSPNLKELGGTYLSKLVHLGTEDCGIKLNA